MLEQKQKKVESKKVSRKKKVLIVGIATAGIL